MKFLTYLFVAVLSLFAAVEAGRDRFVPGGTILDIDHPVKKREIVHQPRRVLEDASTDETK